MINTSDFESTLTIITENASGDMYIINASSVQELFDDWRENCHFVPENKASVFFVQYMGMPIDLPPFPTFEVVMSRLVHLTTRTDN